jgi:hypothetical protein
MKIIFLILAFLLGKSVIAQTQNSTNNKLRTSTSIIDKSSNDSLLIRAPAVNYRAFYTKQHPDYKSAMYYKIDFPLSTPTNFVTTESGPEIYISNFYPGITSFPATSHDNSLVKFYLSLDQNTAYYEYSNIQDTSFCWNYTINASVFNFAKNASLNQSYKNAFNPSATPSTGVYFGRKIYNEFRSTDILGQVLYNIFIFAPKK